MRNPIKASILLLWVIAAGSSMPLVGSAQTTSSASAGPTPEVAFTYSYAHSNAPPGGCGCFSLNGGSASVAIPLRHSPWEIAGDVTVANGSSISSASNDLTLTVFTGGLRYRPNLHLGAWQPFGQVLAGGAYASGSLIQAEKSAGTGSNSAFAANAGGGLDLRLNHRLSLRLVEADYLPTTFNNGTTNHQNNLRISAGLVVRLGK
jgi:peptidoglycan-associated lipoprotein